MDRLTAKHSRHGLYRLVGDLRPDTDGFGGVRRVYADSIGGFDGEEDGKNTADYLAAAYNACKAAGIPLAALEAGVVGELVGIARGILKAAEESETYGDMLISEYMDAMDLFHIARAILAKLEATP